MEGEKKIIKKHSLGICAMEKKVKVIHMQLILENLKKFNEFDLIIFTEDLIFNKPIEEWPIVESMIVFHSNGFPFSKVLNYINLRKPFLINDFDSQKIFWDRSKVLNLLKENNIPVPNGIIVERGEEINNDGENSKELNTSFEIQNMIDEYNKKYNTNSNTSPKHNKENKKVTKTNSLKEDEENIFNFSDKEYKYTENINGNEFKEFDDCIVYKGIKLQKPFVEKPLNGDDHNIYIYYPLSHGGGQKRLFRKRNDLSSLYYPDCNHIRKNQSYIYEEFLQSDGFDIKVYSVGIDYFHAEARKSPTLDGKVKRNVVGKEDRYPINLTAEEKEIARKIVLIFKQNVCGFDILRANGISYVSDVNGWSFVKGNNQYYEDCAIQIRKIILKEIDKELLKTHHVNIKSNKLPVYKEMNFKSQSGTEELRSLISVFRHADRSPKQKLKLIVEDKEILQLFKIFDKKNNSNLNKTKNLNNINNSKNNKNKPNQLKLKKPYELLKVLEIINYILTSKGVNSVETLNDTNSYLVKLFQIKLILEKNENHFEGFTRKIQLKPLEWEVINTDNNNITEYRFNIKSALFIMKWGGKLTHSGIEQARLLGNSFRLKLYPTNDDSGDDLVRLHNTYRHDLKCYSSEEGRCLKTAGAFLQGLLQYEGNLIPIITSMVRKGEQINKLLDANSSDKDTFRKEIKNHIKDFCNFNGNLKNKFISFIGDSKNRNQTKFIELIDKIDNFQLRLKNINKLLNEWLVHLKTTIHSSEKLNECNNYFIKNKDILKPRRETYKSKTNEDLEIFIGKKSYQYKQLKSSKILSVTENSISNYTKNNSNGTINNNVTNNEFDCEEEQNILIIKRYVKLIYDFYDTKKDQFNVGKIPDIYDNIKYDIIHNRELINEKTKELYYEVSLLNNFITPLEYGIKIDEKISIAKKFIKPLLLKIGHDLILQKKYINDDAENDLEIKEKNFSGLDTEKLNDLEIASDRKVKSRFYFTSQSHLYSLLNSLLYCLNSFLVDNNNNNSINNFNKIWSVFNLDYCSHIVFRLFEKIDPHDSKRFRYEITFCPGATEDPILTKNSKHMINVQNWYIINENVSLEQLKKFFDFIFED